MVGLALQTAQKGRMLMQAYLGMMENMKKHLWLVADGSSSSSSLQNSVCHSITVENSAGVESQVIRGRIVVK